MKKIFKRMLYIILGFIIFLVIAYFLFVSFYPSFGGDNSKDRQALYSQSSQFEGGVFHNKNRAVPKNFSTSEILTMTRKFFFEKVPNGTPKADLKVEKIDSANIADYQGKARLVWYGHSAFLLQIQGKNILLDPMFGKVSAPHPWLGGSRFNSELPLEIEKLPQIDAILFSHDHYDHLDYESVMKLKAKTQHFFVPLGVGVHLEAWDIPKEKITEMDWWQETQYMGLTFACTPSQHFSGRKLNNRMSTLWSSWVIQSREENIYFSGDSGYSTHFKKIGKKYGPFDLAMMECGQYNKMWHDIHMMPEETAQAGLDLQAKRMLPIHWAGFKLALHSWKDPIERVLVKAKELNLSLITPRIGEIVYVKDSTTRYSNWWENIE